MTVYGYDISSAYPYHLFQLPCLACGRWQYTTKERDLRGCTTALVHYSYRARRKYTWAPYPVRAADGSICYPSRGEGWVWLSEFDAGRRLFETVRFLGAWVYRTDCDCHPFASVPDLYRQRVSLGKDAAGIVLKLAINSLYGKLAQSTGINPRYQSWVWAGMVTAGTRAQILDLMAVAPHMTDILAIATDGVYSRRKLKCPRPIDTGTFDVVNEKGEHKPLGGWEEKEYPNGLFFVKPGIYFAPDDADKDDALRARGIGRRALLENKAAIIAAYESGAETVKIGQVERFHGAKTSISKALKRSERYGEWLPMPIELRFSCPNRGADMMPLTTDYLSHPYSKGLMNAEKMAALLDEAIEYEQPA